MTGGADDPRRVAGAERPALALPLKVAHGLVWLGGALSTVLILAAFALTIYAVFMRYVMNAPLRWSEDVTGWLLVSLIMLGAAEAYRRNTHISIDLLTGGLRGHARRVQAAFADLAVLAFAGVLGLSAWEAVEFARDFGAYTAGSVEVPLWWVQSPLVAGASLLGVTALSRILLHLTGGLR